MQTLSRWSSCSPQRRQHVVTGVDVTLLEGARAVRTVAEARLELWGTPLVPAAAAPLLPHSRAGPASMHGSGPLAH